MAPHKLVAVRWEDAKMLEGGPWCENKPRAYEAHEVITVGFLVLDEPRGVHIVSSWHPDLISPPDQIPRGMIREIVELAPAPVNKPRSARCRPPR